MSSGPSPNHDAVLNAFLALEPRLVHAHWTHSRGGVPGYTHIHGPSHPGPGGRCSNHALCIERYNGTVCFRKDLAMLLGAHPRPSMHIRKHELGYSSGKNFGSFSYALAYPEIVKPSLRQFVQDVIGFCQASGQW